MKKILFVNSSARLYGSDKSLLDILRKLSKNSFHVIVLLPNAGPLVEEINGLGIPVIVERFAKVERRILNPFVFLRFLMELVASTKRIMQIIREEGIDLVHSNTTACLPSAIAATITKTPHVWHIRELVEKPRMVRIFYKLAIPMLSNKAIAISQAVRKNYEGKSLGKAKFVVLSHGIDVTRFANTCDVLRPEYSIDPRTMIVGSVGMLRIQKGQQLFLKVAKAVSDIYPKVIFVIVGDLFYKEGEVDSALISMRDALGLTEKVLFTGFRKDIENVLSSIDIFVHTSLYQEAYGRTILEAMAAGRPVVAFQSGGPIELVMDGLTGFLVPSGNVELMAERILRLVKDNSLRAAMGQEGKRRLESNFSSEQYILELESLYAELIV